MIEVKDLNIGYVSKKKTVSVFSNINLSFNSGKLVGLIGDNGVGKSTLIKTLTGFIKPLAGTILIDKKDILAFSAYDLSKTISIVSTEKVGGFNLTVFDVVALGRTPYISVFGKLNEIDIECVEKSLQTLSINHLRDKLIDELSDGQRQKVMIAKSLAQETSIIILDEPTAFLDYKSKHNLFEVLKSLCIEQNKLVLVSSHDIDLMEKYVTKSVALLSENSIEIKSY